MRVGIYDSHHGLPFWHPGDNPKWVFDPSILEDWTTKKRRTVDGLSHTITRPAAEHIMMPVLTALNDLQIPGVMAHVSTIFDHEKKEMGHSHRAWVQITTETPENDENGLPIVFKDGHVQVYHLWGGDNGTYNPYGLLPEQDQKIDQDAQFWSNFFLSKLREVKSHTFSQAREAIQKADHLLYLHSLLP